MWWLTYQDSPGSTETSLLTTAGGAAVAGAELRTAGLRTAGPRTAGPAGRLFYAVRPATPRSGAVEGCHCRAPPVLYITTQQHTSYQLPASSYQLTAH